MLRPVPHASADVGRNPADLAIDRLDLVGINARANLQFKRPDRLDDRLRAPDTASRAIERREEAVPGGVDFGAPVSRKHRADDRVMPLDELAPRAVPRTIALVVDPTTSVNKTVASTS